MDRRIFPLGKEGSLIDAGPTVAELIKPLVDQALEAKDHLHKLLQMF
jgi:hypothetical protein